ncbi:MULTISPECIES: transposase, partial [Asaia]|uniref:transposase n=1 Tax=Asaia TaxID=91914 RepID=UPI002FC39157
RSAQNADQNEPKSNQSNRQKPEITGQDHQSRVLRSLQGYDADWFRDALEEKGIKPCIPGLKSRGKPVKYDKRKYKRRNRIEIMFGRLKDWRRVATRYDRCPTVFFSAICLAATVMFWL